MVKQFDANHFKLLLIMIPAGALLFLWLRFFSASHKRSKRLKGILIASASLWLVNLLYVQIFERNFIYGGRHLNVAKLLFDLLPLHLPLIIHALLFIALFFKKDRAWQLLYYVGLPYAVLNLFFFDYNALYFYTGIGGYFHHFLTNTVFIVMIVTGLSQKLFRPSVKGLIESGIFAAALIVTSYFVCLLFNSVANPVVRRTIFNLNGAYGPGERLTESGYILPNPLLDFLWRLIPVRLLYLLPAAPFAALVMTLIAFPFNRNMFKRKKAGEPAKKTPPPAVIAPVAKEKVVLSGKMRIGKIIAACIFGLLAANWLFHLLYTGIFRGQRYYAFIYNPISFIEVYLFQGVALFQLIILGLAVFGKGKNCKIFAFYITMLTGVLCLTVPAASNFIDYGGNFPDPYSDLWSMHRYAFGVSGGLELGYLAPHKIAFYLIRNLGYIAIPVCFAATGIYRPKGRDIPKALLMLILFFSLAYFMAKLYGRADANLEFYDMRYYHVYTPNSWYSVHPDGIALFEFFFRLSGETPYWYMYFMLPIAFAAFAAITLPFCKKSELKTLPASLTGYFKGLPAYWVKVFKS